jgi:hypothetical protein
MRLNSLLTLSFVGTMIFVGCGGGGGSAGTDPIIPPADIDVNVTITDEYQVEILGTVNTINANISVEDTAKDLYLVLSNSANVSGSSTITHNAKAVEVAQAKSVLPSALTERPGILRHPQYVEDFSSQIGTLLSTAEASQPQAKILAVPERMDDVESVSQIFYLDTTTTSTTTATARKVIKDVPTSYGLKTLNIWVSDDSFDKEDGSNDCIKARCVKQAMVDALADYFLVSELDNDIYDWVTNIYGEEWDSDAQNKYPNLIGADNEITILLTDIDGDNSPNGGVIGFFWSKDNFDKSYVSGSNERVMFYADAVMFANGEDTWDIDDSWPKEMVSTLAHEFQHMINFYQKYILLNTDTDTWINEMLSESTEDIIATKIGHSVEGRYPLFNANNTLSLTAWNSQLADYAKVNVFGAYLLRNYGGAKLLHDIMHTSYEDERAIVDAVNKSPEGLGKTFPDLLREWGVAIMLSDHDNLVDTPVYNIGTLFENVYGSTIYEMRSINLFNYTPQPTIYTTSGTVEPQGNYYYKIGENLTGDINISLELNGQTEATLIAK